MTPDSIGANSAAGITRSTPARFAFVPAPRHNRADFCCIAFGNRQDWW
jgi:hypothetical protein